MLDRREGAKRTTCIHKHKDAATKSRNPYLVGASSLQVATTPPSPTAANRSPLGANRTAAALPQLASLRGSSLMKFTKVQEKHWRNIEAHSGSHENGRTFNERTWVQLWST